MKIMIIGASHAGYETAEAIHETLPTAKIDWFDLAAIQESINWSKQRGEVTNPTVNQMSDDELISNNIRLHSNFEAITLDPNNHQVTFKNHQSDDRETFGYDKLIIATGSHATVLPIPGNHFSGIANLRHGHQHDLKVAIKKETTKNVVVIGGGYIGMMATNLLSQMGKNVTIIDTNSRPLATYLDSELTDVLSTHLQEKEINFVGNTKVSAFIADNHQQVSAVETDHGTFPADFVLVAAGTQPNTAWLNNAIKINSRGFIITDNYSKTSDADIFAIGDSTEILYNPTNTKLNISLASNAERQARVAVRNLVEATTPLHGVQGSSGLSIFGEYFASTGLNTLTAQKASIAIKSVYVEQSNIMPGFSREPEHKVRFKLFYAPDSMTILGAEIMSTVNETQQINAISIAIQMKMTVNQLADADLFFQPGLTNLWNIMNVAAIKALN